MSDLDSIILHPNLLWSLIGLDWTRLESVDRHAPLESQLSLPRICESDRTRLDSVSVSSAGLQQSSVATAMSRND